MRAEEAFHALNQDICAAVNRNYGWTILVLERIRRVP